MTGNSMIQLRITAAICIACVLGAGTAAASAAPTQPAQWRIAYTSGRAFNTTFYAVTAPSRSDAWAAGYTTARNGVVTADFAHWNGSRWRAAAISSVAGFRPWVAESTSPSDVWFFGALNSTFEALHHVDGRWRLMATPGDISAPTIAVLGSKDLWMVGLGGSCDVSTNQCTSQLEHWNGASWSSSTLNVEVLGVTGGSGGVWAISLTDLSNVGSAVTLTGKVVLYKWTAGAWQQFAAPDPQTTTGALLAAGPGGQLWLAAPPLGNSPWVVRHWTGTRWTHVQIPRSFLPLLDLGPVTSDLGDGVWLGPFLHWTGSRWAASSQDQFPSLCGYSFQAIAAVPRSHSLWAAGDGCVSAKADVRMVAVYGPLP